MHVQRWHIIGASPTRIITRYKSLQDSWNSSDWGYSRHNVHCWDGKQCVCVCVCSHAHAHTGTQLYRVQDVRTLGSGPDHHSTFKSREELRLFEDLFLLYRWSRTLRSSKKPWNQHPSSHPPVASTLWQLRIPSGHMHITNPSVGGGASQKGSGVCCAGVKAIGL